MTDAKRAPLSLAQMKEVLPHTAGLLHSLLGCEWGRRIALPEDMEPCAEQAVGMTCVHAPPGVEPEEMVFKLCRRHHELLETQCVPHEGATVEDLRPL